LIDQGNRGIVWANLVENEDPPDLLRWRGRYRLRQKKQKKYHKRRNSSDS
jgi:hypothetical protein